MKSRIVQTRIWNDNYFSSLNRLEKLAFFYLLTNPFIGQTGCYELSDKQACFDLDCSLSEWQLLKAKFTSDNKVVFYEGWVRVVNANKYQNFNNGSDLQKQGYESEMALVPKELLKQSNQLLDNHFTTTLQPSIISNKYQVISKEGGVGETKEVKTSKNSLVPCTMVEVYELAKKYDVSIEAVLDVQDSLQNYIQQYPKKYKLFWNTLINWVKMRREKNPDWGGEYPIKIKPKDYAFLKIDPEKLKSNPHSVREMGDTSDFQKALCYHFGIVPPNDL